MNAAASPARPTARPTAPARIRFSLGGLFRALTVCGVGLFAAVQLGPLVAIRIVAVGLAIWLAVLAWRGRSGRLWLAAAALAFAGWLPTIVAAGAPFSHRDAVCFECGRSRVIHEHCGWTTHDEIQDTQVSRWAAPLLSQHVPQDHTHRWTVTSSYTRTHWFGSAPIGCGGFPEGAHMAWQFAYLGDQATAEKIYAEYLDIRHGRSTKPLSKHQQEASLALNALVAKQRP